MPIGDNQLNVFLAEVGYKKIVRAPVTGTFLHELTLTTGIHPLLVAPSKIQYEDVSRTPILQTTGGSLETSSGRALRVCSVEGTFGVDNRGLLLYLGTGEIRFQRFYKEVVRMSDALFDADVDANVNAFSIGPVGVPDPASTPGVQLLVANFSEDDSTFYMNWYDFWHNIAFQGQIKQFSFWREHRNGGASGLIHYRMVIQEVGPIVTGNLTSSIINGLLQGMSFWGGLNEAIESYTLGNILDSLVAGTAPFQTLWESTKDSFQAQIDSARQLMGGKANSGGSRSSFTAQEVPGTTTTTTTTTTTASSKSTGASAMATLEAQQAIATYFSTAAEFASAASEAALDVSSQMAPFDSETGQIDYGDQIGEGGSDELVKWDELLALLDFEESARWQPVAGCLFGMDRETYRSYIEAGGAANQAAPEISGSVPYSVCDTDTPQSIEARFGVSWARILSLNRLTPDEALYVGRTLRIPRLRARGQPGIAGLPTLGSHVGKAAWGVDLDAEMDADADGDFAVVEEEDVLVQGAEFIVDTFGEPLIKSLETVPSDVKVPFIQKQLTEIFKSDQRVEAIEEVAVDFEGAGVDVQVRFRAINGGTVTTGG